MSEQTNLPVNVSAKVVSIIAFSLMVIALVVAIVTDFVIFADQIISFFVASFASVFAFLGGIILMIISIMLIFGIFLLKENGFWPINWATSLFKEIMSEHMPTKEQVSLMSAIRVMLILVCLVTFILSIVALSMNKSAPKNGLAKSKLVRTFGIITLIFSLLGGFTGIISLIILSLF